ncbi:MAG: hypothetical protein NWF09_05930 [Candidatus Bathyarchaeota archaeon]|nr:hypothetical protein [Candidatus Bathyarchaeota archaeon]
MDYYQTVATVSLILQVAALCLIFAGLELKRRKRLRQHGLAMLAAVAMHTVLILVWMVPSFASLFIASTNFADAFVVAALVHAFSGVAADALGIWLVASWRLRADMQVCFAKKGVMRITIVLWLIALLLGIALYLKIIQIL